MNINNERLKKKMNVEAKKARYLDIMQSQGFLSEHNAGVPIIMP